MDETQAAADKSVDDAVDEKAIREAEDAGRFQHTDTLGEPFEALEDEREAPAIIGPVADAIMLVQEAQDCLGDKFPKKRAVLENALKELRRVE